ncbi:MAG: efflux RND transporter periplasmic adaptor subunit [Vicinamibacteria bacterium]|nr:efflux RND transporter periplasmic adaptor subunit [Vicinamibacteria bacterium]
MRIAKVVLVLLSAGVLVGAGYYAGTRHAPHAGAEAKKELWHCPMHPEFTSDRQQPCPICGMDLVLVDGPGDAPAAATGGEVVAGRAPLTLSAEKRQVLGVASEPVKRGEGARTLRTVGVVAVDERRLHHVHTRFEGYVEHLHVDFTGKFVEEGEPLLSIYSPDLVATQQEYLLALKAQREMERRGAPETAAAGRGLLEAARQRLLLWDIPEAELTRLEASGAPQRTLELRSRISGYVVAKNVDHGQRVMPQDTLFEIADLSRLWVLADVYEHDLPNVKLGQPGEITVPSLAGRTFRGTVTYVAPTVEEKTRTVKVRLEVDNPGGILKPDMYVDVTLETGGAPALVVPFAAVIDAGERRLVFLDRGEGRYEPREVRLGARVEGGYQVLAGLDEGDRVVTAANFLIDSESSLEAALRGLKPTPGEAAPAAPAHQH